MNPIAMALLLIAGWGIFAYSAWRRWRLMKIGAPENRFDQPGRRFAAMFRYAIAQMRMRRYPLSGIAHMAIFLGFVVLLLRSLILWGRGFDPSFDFWIFGSDQPLGKIYSLLKDIFVVLVFVGALVFLYFRTVKKLPRLTHTTEGLVILLIILVMMAADVLYDGAHINLEARRHQHNTVALAPVNLVGNSSLAADAVTISARTADGRFIRTTTPKGAPTLSAFDIKETGYVVEDRDMLAAAAPILPSFTIFEPAGSLAAKALVGADQVTLTALVHIGFWTHSVLVLLFLNLLPYSKHFHVITAIPNVYLQNLDPPGRLPNLEDIEGKLEREETLGIKRIDQFSWKAILDFYTCTECGRCSDYCPATNTGKKLSPKHFTIDLRNFLYTHEQSLVATQSGNGEPPNSVVADDSGQITDQSGPEAQAASGSEPRPSGSGQDSNGAAEAKKDLVDGVIDPEVLWACTTCRACEQECPVFISYVDKIVDMRRYLVQERAEFPAEFQSAFRGLETNANPWSFPAADRANWAEGLDIKTIAENPEAPVLFWVGCAPSFDERAKKVTVATVKLLQQAGVDFVILGAEEQCTGDPARRAGNEYLFQMFAQANVEALNSYEAGKKKIVTTCPHCFNTLLNEYPDFGGKFDVVHHTTYLAQLVEQGKITPTKRIDRRVAYHDSCYLGRYNEEYDSPRKALASIPGLTLVEPAQTRDRGMCCGAGGAQMFKEEEPGDARVNVTRTEQLLDTNPDTISSACPFCMRMLTDGLAEKDKEDLPQLDVAEMLWEAVGEA